MQTCGVQSHMLGHASGARSGRSGMSPAVAVEVLASPGAGTALLEPVQCRPQ